VIGKERVSKIVSAAGRGEDLAALLRVQPELADADIDALLDPAGYIGLAGLLIDRAVSEEQS
jgi:3-carboxy-cis,cis-muconate cycloisomerase